jgi:hypothetical protein
MPIDDLILHYPIRRFLCRAGQVITAQTFQKDRWSCRRPVTPPESSLPPQCNSWTMC